MTWPVSQKAVASVDFSYVGRQNFNDHSTIRLMLDGMVLGTPSPSQITLPDLVSTPMIIGNPTLVHFILHSDWCKSSAAQPVNSR